MHLFCEWYLLRRPPAKQAYTMEELAEMGRRERKYGSSIWSKVMETIEGRAHDNTFYDYMSRYRQGLATGRWGHRHTVQLLVIAEHIGA